MSNVKLIEFHDGMKKHFGINNAGRFLDQILLRMGTVSLDVIAFDEWLMNKHDDYDQAENVSMSLIIIDKYGEDAEEWAKKAI